MKRIGVILAMGLAVAGCQGNAPRDQSPRWAADADLRYLQEVAGRDQNMIALAAAAESKASEAHFRTMAHNAIAKQQADLRQVEEWLKTWYGTGYTTPTTAEGRQMLERLNAHTGKDFDREYLTDMIHEYQRNVIASRPVAESSSRLQEHLAEVNGVAPNHDGHSDEHPHSHDEH